MKLGHLDCFVENTPRLLDWGREGGVLGDLFVFLPWLARCLGVQYVLLMLQRRRTSHVCRSACGDAWETITPQFTIHSWGFQRWVHSTEVFRPAGGFGLRPYATHGVVNHSGNAMF